MSDRASARPITEVAAGLGISRDHLQLYGDDKAKVALEARAGKPQRGRLRSVPRISKLRSSARIPGQSARVRYVVRPRGLDFTQSIE
jgi:hypothetical protein